MLKATKKSKSVQGGISGERRSVAIPRKEVAIKLLPLPPASFLAMFTKVFLETRDIIINIVNRPHGDAAFQLRLQCSFKYKYCILCFWGLVTTVKKQRIYIERERT